MEILILGTSTLATLLGLYAYLTYKAKKEDEKENASKNA